MMQQDKVGQTKRLTHIRDLFDDNGQEISISAILQRCADVYAPQSTNDRIKNYALSQLKTMSYSEGTKKVGGALSAALGDQRFFENNISRKDVLKSNSIANIGCAYVSGYQAKGKPFLDLKADILAMPYDQGIFTLGACYYEINKKYRP